MTRIDGPDFICVGLPKAGTGWVYDQLNAHPDFWMPPVKELLYLNREFTNIPLSGSRGGGAVKALQRPVEELKQSRRKEHLVHRDREKDMGFVEAARAAHGQKRDMEIYAGLFKFKGDKLSGDISPVYTLLNPEVIRALAERLPDTKIFLVARDPIARAWSRISMLNRGEKFDVGLLGDREAFREFLENSNKIQGKSEPTHIVEHWRTYAPNMPVRVFLFDDIAEDPERARRDIWVYLGADPNKECLVDAGYNRKSKVKKLEMTEPARDALVDFFKDEIRACAAMFGSHANAWVARYGL